MRTVSATTTTEIAKTVTRPFYLVELGLPTPVRYSSRGTVTWNSQSWLSATIRLSMNGSTWSLSIFNETLLFGQSVLSSGTTGRYARVYQLYGDGPTYAVDDAEQLLDGQMGRAIIGDTIEITLKPRPPQRTPRLYINPPIFNHVPPTGTQIRTATGIYTLERA